jgi:hypothetical protein
MKNGLNQFHTVRRHLYSFRVKEEIGTELRSERFSGHDVKASDVKASAAL